MSLQGPKLHSLRPRLLAPETQGLRLNTGKPKRAETGLANVSPADPAHNGGARDIPAVLAAQVAMLQGLFVDLVRKSEEAHGYLDAAEAYMRLALRAQAQLLATIGALAACEDRSSE